MAGESAEAQSPLLMGKELLEEVEGYLQILLHLFKGGKSLEKIKVCSSKEESAFQETEEESQTTKERRQSEPLKTFK